jgi:hypothetical protein
MANAQFNADPAAHRADGGTNTSAVTLTTNGTATLTNNIALGKEHIKVIVDTMKERNIPPYVNDDYVCLAHPTTLRKVKNDLETIHQYVETGLRMIMNGEDRPLRVDALRRADQHREGSGPTRSRTGRTSSAKTRSRKASRFPRKCAGRSRRTTAVRKGVAWYYLGGFGIVHTVAANARILKWDSQA